MGSGSMWLEKCVDLETMWLEKGVYLGTMWLGKMIFLCWSVVG